MKPVLVLFPVLLLVGELAAQGCGLTSTVEGTSWKNGIMFDVRNVSTGNVTVTGLDSMFLANSTVLCEIYYVTAGTSHLGKEGNPAAWTLAGSLPALAVTGPGTLNAIPIALNVVIPPSGTQGFYVTTNNAPNNGVWFTSGVGPSGTTVFAADPHIQSLTGRSLNHAFGAQTAGFFGPGFNGRIRYSLGNPAYETNDAGSSMAFNGLQGTQCTPAAAARCVNSTETVSLSSTHTGAPWEVAVSSMPLVPVGGGGIAVGGQIVNVNLADPYLVYLNGGALPVLAPFPGNIAAQIPTGSTPRTISAQQIVIAPTQPAGLRLSQGCQIDITTSATMAGPVDDDSFIMVSPSAAPICGPATVPFYGTSYTRLFVNSNGRVTTGAGSINWVPSQLMAQTGPAGVGVWADFAPHVAGSITIDRPSPDLLRFAWSGVPYNYAVGTPHSFEITMNTTSGVVKLAGLGGIVPVTSQHSVWIGTSPGTSVGAASDPGQAAFAPAGSGTTSSPNSMIYRMGLTGPASIIPGISTITFTPNAFNNYNWTSN